MPSRNEKIEQNLGLVHTCAHRLEKRGIAYDDLFSAGCIGLCKAVDGFDESRGFAFSTYAVPVILGEMRRLFRDDGLLKVSRSLKEEARRAQNLALSLQAERGREITVEELAKALGKPVFETAELLNLLQPVSSLTQLFEGEEGKERDVPEDNRMQLENRLLLQEAMESLPQNQRHLLELRYYKGFTQTKTAELLGLSQVQVSRLEHRILQTMREKMTG